MPLFVTIHIPKILLLWLFCIFNCIADQPEYKVRTWTSTVGSTIEGRYSSSDGESVTITQENGAKLDVPLSKLTEEDQQYVHKVLIQSKPYVIAVRDEYNHFLGQIHQMADHVPMRLEIVGHRDPRIGYSSKLEHPLAKWDGKPAYRYMVFINNLKADASSDDRRDFKSYNNSLSLMAKKWGFTPLVISKDDMNEDQLEWIEGIEGGRIVPYGELLTALRKEDPRWNEVLSNPQTAQYLKHAVILSTLTGQKPPLRAMRASLRKDFRDFEKEQVSFRDLARLPEEQVASLERLVLKVITDANKR